MSERVTASQAARLLDGADHILILTHQFPDGDTLGSGFALCLALRKLGKTVRVACSDPIPEKYEYMTAHIPMPDFEPAYVCAVDVADVKLLGGLSVYGDRVDLCIDHHGSNVEYAQSLLLDAGCAATAMLIFQVIQQLGVALDKDIAQCLYTGLATDTGCFKYANTTAEAHRMAADFMECGIPCEMINRTMFDVKSRARVELERLALDSMTFYFQGRCAIMIITNDMVEQSGACENDMEGLAPIPRQIEGVWVGVTLRQKPDGNFKVSVGTGNHADAADICGRLGGGGHVRAAGCAMNRTAEEGVARLLAAIEASVPAITRP